MRKRSDIPLFFRFVHIWGVALTFAIMLSPPNLGLGYEGGGIPESQWELASYISAGITASVTLICSMILVCTTENA